MAILKKNELKQMEKNKAEEKLLELKKQLMKSNSQLSNKSPPENPGQIGVIKKTIAKILTKLNEKEKIKEKQ